MTNGTNTPAPPALIITGGSGDHAYPDLVGPGGWNAVILHGAPVGKFRRDADHTYRADADLSQAMGSPGDPVLGRTIADACRTVRTAFGFEPSQYRGV